MANDYFQFKQFTIRQGLSAMKVGTDGVLLGAWAFHNTDEKLKVLDIGTGTGVIALMMAQRMPNAYIDAVEIEKDSSVQALENFKESKWSDRLRVINMSLQHFCRDNTGKYDYIISNPPYFINSLKNEDAKKMAARHSELLPYDELIESVVSLLLENGTFAAILPYEEAALFIVKAAQKGLYCHRRTDVKGLPHKPFKRVLMELKKGKSPNSIFDQLTIETERHLYTDKYKQLTSGFYIK